MKETNQSRGGKPEKEDTYKTEKERVDKRIRTEEEEEEQRREERKQQLRNRKEIRERRAEEE